MNLWLWVGVAGALGLLVKYTGHLVPAWWLERPQMVRGAGLLTVGLLAALVGAQSLTSGQAVVLDARLAGLAAAVVALMLRAPFLVVVIAAAATTAALRFIT